jgi:hypothetical protein
MHYVTCSPHMRKITEIRDLGTEVEVSEGVKPANSSW